MELFHRCEWWEILGLLYCTWENNVLEKKAYDEQNHLRELEDKLKNGKIKTYYKPNMTAKEKALVNKYLGKK